MALTRREFLKGISLTVAALGLPAEFIPRMVQAAMAKKRPPVIWLHFQECTGCTETLLRASHPDVAKLIFELISLDYHETIMAAAGHQAEKSLHDSVQANKGKYICVVEGGIPTADKGIHCKIAGKTGVQIIKEVANNAAAVIAIGTCAAFGGVQAAKPNPTRVKSAGDLIKGPPVVNIPGCPPNPANFLGFILHYLTFGKLPALDKLGRPKFAYGRLIHDHCERRAHFDDGRYAEEFGGEGHKLGYCLYKLGCKGPQTYANCPTARFNDVGAWPVGIGHGCAGCTEPGFWDNGSFYERLPEIAGLKVDEAGGKATGAVAVAAGVHAVAGVGRKLAKAKGGK